MKILFLLDDLGWFRGTQRMFFESIRHFKSCGHDVIAWGYSKCGETADRIGAMGVKVIKGIESMPVALAFYPDIVNIHRGGSHSDTDTDILTRFKRQGAKIVETSVFGRVDRNCVGVIDLSLQISRWDLYRWKVWKGSIPVPGVYLPYIVDTDSFFKRAPENTVSFKRKFDIPAEAFVIGRAGKTSWEKLSEAILSILDKYPIAYFLSVDDYNVSMPDKLLDHPRVRKIPRLYSNEELSEFYSACSVFISASPFGESFGMVVAEAMACGTPIVATANPECDNAQAEVVQHGEGGLIVASAKDIDSAISILIEDPSLRDNFAKKARHLITSRYSRNIVCNMLDAAFDAVISDDIVNALHSKGLITFISHSEIHGLIQNVIGTYALSVRMYQWQNLHYFWRRMYEIYCKVMNVVCKR